MITPSLLNENQKTNNLSSAANYLNSLPVYLGTFLANARTMPIWILLGKTENFPDPKTEGEVPAIILTHSYKIFLK